MASAFLSSLQLFILAESLGAVESLAESPAIMTHARWAVEPPLLGPHILPSLPPPSSSIHISSYPTRKFGLIC